MQGACLAVYANWMLTKNSKLARKQKAEAMPPERGMGVPQRNSQSRCIHNYRYSIFQNVKSKQLIYGIALILEEITIQCPARRATSSERSKDLLLVETAITQHLRSYTCSRSFLFFHLILIDFRW
jgi:hypothetical protein